MPRIRPCRACFGKLSVVLIALAAVAAVVPTCLSLGAAPATTFARGFSILPNRDMTRRPPQAVTYTINNGPATFKLAVADPDEHCDQLFRDYAACLRYCREHNLPVIPSVQLVQGKLKQFDDGLCATLELALQQTQPDGEVLGKQAALARLLAALLAQRPPADMCLLERTTLSSTGMS